MSDEEKQRRNMLLATSIGSVILPLPGLIGALLFYARDDRDAAWLLLVSSALGILLYVLILGLL